MKFKRTLSAVICACIALGTIVPLLLSMFPVSQAKEIYTTRIEAENARWNGYQKVKASSVTANYTVVGDAASSHTYATWSELSALKLNKNLHIYVAFCVDVPVAGTYKISTGNVIRMSADCTPYATILVNPQQGGQAYKLNYSAVSTTAAHCVSEQVSVQLQKGRNMIYMVPFTGDQKINWSDADYIEIVGDYPVSHIIPMASASAVEVAANAGGSHKFSSATSGALSGADVSAAKGITSASLTRAQLSSLPHVSYTVEAPADGYYDISLNYQYSGSISGYSVALLVDNRPAETKPIYATSDTVADISTYLTKGVHVLTIPVVLPSTDSGKTITASSLKGLTLYDGLALSDQFNGYLTGSVLEAESTALTWRYTSVYADNGRTMIGGSQPGLEKQTYAQLAAGAALDKNQPMLTYQIDVLEAGDYTLNVGYRNYASSDYYMIVSVDDTTYAKAVCIGTDPNNANRWIASTTLTLTKGRHFVRLITLPGDSQASWIDVDYAAFKGPSPVIGVKDWKHLQSANATAYQGFSGTVSYNSNGEWWNYALSGYQGNSMAAAAGVTTANFTPADLSDLAWVSYNIHVPRDGFYDMQTYLRPDPNTSGTGKILLGIQNNNVSMINQAQGVIGLHYSGNSAGWLDMEGEYKAFGVSAKNYGSSSSYAMILRVRLDNGKFYAFRIYKDSTGYSYSRYGDGGSSSGWGGQIQVDANATALLDGNGAKFQVERTSGNTLALTLNGKVIDTYTMSGVSSSNKVVSIGFKQCGTPANSANPVEVPFEVTPVQPAVKIDLPGIENGTVTTEKSSYKVGDTVVLNVNPLNGYSQKLTVNGNPILLDWKTGQYSFKATTENYTVEGCFEKIQWNNTTYRWVDVQLDKGAQQWWIADLSSYLSEGDYTIFVSGLLDYSGGSKDRCDIGALTVSGGITSPCETNSEDNPVINAITKADTPNELLFTNEPLITDLADPFVLDNTARDGYYYLYGTWGAIRCYRSKNLTDWQLYDEVLWQYRNNNKVWDNTIGKYSYQVLGSDVWAPEVVYDPDTQLYYMFFSATPDKPGQAVAGNAKEMLMVATSTSPTGPFNLVNFKDATSCGAENVHTYNTNTYSDYFAPYLFLDPAKNNEFSIKINNGESRASQNGGYVRCIDPHPYVAPDGTKYLFWVDNYGPDRICGVEMENWLKPKWETAKAVIYYSYYTVDDWKNGSTNLVSYETPTTTNEGPFVVEHNGKYYMTYSGGNYKNNTYFVAQAVADNVLGPYTKMKESEGGILLSGNKQGSQTNSGTGHHSMVTVGDQLMMVYHRHNDPAVGGGARNHAIDEVKWVTIGGKEVMYVNGPNATAQPKVEKYSDYRNIAEEATVTGNNSSANLTYLNDGLLSHYKKAHANVTNAVGETVISGTTTFTFRFDEARPVKSIMVYNSRLNAQVFRQVKQIKLVCLENGKMVEKYIYNVPFNSEYYTVDSSGKITYVEPCAAAYAIFDELNVLAVEITMEVPSGQTSVGISEIRILGK